MLQDRKILHVKQRLVREIQECKTNFKLDVDKLKIMPIDELIKKKHKILIHHEHVMASKHLQKWWRNRLARKKTRSFAPLGLWELIKMIDKV